MAEENIIEIESNPLKILRLPIIVAVLVIIAAIYMLINNLAPNIQTLTDLNRSYAGKIQEYENKTKDLSDIKAQKAAEEADERKATDDSNLGKAFYKPLETGIDPESAIASEFNEILTLMTKNKIKTRSITYVPEPKDDPFVNGALAKYSVCRLDMDMIANYNDFKNFLKDLYKHEHYLDITKVEVRPYPKDKSILLISFQLKLYAQKV